MTHAVHTLHTPAEEVRTIHQRQGWKALSLEEQEWSVMDMKLEPEQYKWVAAVVRAVLGQKQNFCEFSFSNHCVYSGLAT